MVPTQRFFSAVAGWLPLAAVFTVALGFAYVGIQQTYRQGANDPQIQMAEDLAEKIHRGADPRSVVPADKVDIRTSLAPYVFVFDAGVNLLGTSAELDGQQVVPPRGALDAVVEHGQNRVTWQPQAGVRQALVVVQGAEPRSDIIAVGRSLREVEKREGDLGVMFLLAWGVGLSLSLGATILVRSGALA